MATKGIGTWFWPALGAAFVGWGVVAILTPAKPGGTYLASGQYQDAKGRIWTKVPDPTNARGTIQYVSASVPPLKVDKPLGWDADAMGVAMDQA